MNSALRYTRILALVLVGSVLEACGPSNVFAPVDFPKHAAGPRPPFHVVRSGETLYSIAWHYGLDYHRLAAWNHISPPYTIYPRQRLSLHEPRVLAADRAAPRAPPRSPAAPTAHRVAKAQPSGVTYAATRSPPRSASAPPDGDRRSILHWRWPTRGKMVKSFAETGDKGIDIAGKLGQPVRAAAPGRVVYSGGGLIGYGKLIILRHNHNYLSAYAHNEKLLVKEGERVKAGQTIAEMGHSGTDRVMLHFEIRHDGKPVNPLPFLSP